jgi:hypothetical protein
MEANYKNRQTVKTIWAISAFVVLLLLLFYGLGNSPDPGSYPFLLIVGLAAAGATGALVRSIIFAPDEAAPFMSLGLGAITGGLVGIAYMVPQFISGSVVQVLPDKTSVVPWTSKVQFISAVLIGFSAGMGLIQFLAK